MAAMSAAQATSTLTPPSSSHGNGYPWDVSSASHHEQTHSPEKRPTRKDSSNSAPRSPFLPQNGNAAAYNTGTGLDTSSRKPNGTDSATFSKEPGYLSPPHGPEGNQGTMKDSASPADSLLELYGSSRSVPPPGKKRPTKEIHGDTYEFDDESSKWIHRDKLARIESEELQAAGIILPKARARSKPRREQSSEKMNGHRKHTEGEHTRSRKNSTITTTEPKTPEAPVPSWDLRLPEEIETEGDGYWISIPGTNGSSKIPVAKTSPVPIPLEQLERDTPMIRKRDHSPGDDTSISMPKARRTRSGSIKALDMTATPITQPKRSATDVSPKKLTGTAATRKSSAPAKANNQTGRPKTRGGPNTNSGSSSGGTRPSTRSGERELSPGAVSAKQPEGDPPWMVSAYRPDPRLPPDQQLLPTVARRLQQEKWEKEGKFGNIYDKEFRPLTDEGFLSPPEPDPNAIISQEDDTPDEWPLKTEARSPTLMPPGRTNSYSTIPKIQEKPNMSPLASPRTPVPQAHPSPVIRAPEPQEEQKEKGGCGCCIVM